MKLGLMLGYSGAKLRLPVDLVQRADTTLATKPSATPTTVVSNNDAALRKSVTGRAASSSSSSLANTTLPLGSAGARATVALRSIERLLRAHSRITTRFRRPRTPMAALQLLDVAGYAFVAAPCPRRPEPPKSGSYS